MLKIGEIIGAHGIRGEVKVYPFTDFPQRFTDMQVITVQKGAQKKQLHVERARRHKNIFILKCREVTDRNHAESLKGWDVVVDYRDAMPLPEDEYYDHQLVGLEVWDLQSQTPVGVLTEVLHLPANAVFTVVREDGSEVLIPALKQVVRRVDVEKGRMEIWPLEGMWE
ncbi:MAG: 16S rRNA processing protein RimM [Firmicutes bacterium]|nr:16S rRNA processing protein RimM [Bacillota bacterium]HPZ90144.1 ribosome maturation factor RimM [Bacillota bacterium]HQE01090.1 ribosome maturation factor RimM [Bacillota bacterium]